MIALQAGIGAMNDIVDAPTDAGLKPGKPIPAGRVSLPVARVVAAAGFVVGLALVAPSGPVLILVALAVMGIGLSYDLRLKGTAWSWLPFAAGIPILPVYGWLGASGTLPSLFLVLVPAAVAAGAALAISNALVDHERDRAAGVGSVVTRLGPGRAWAVHAGLVMLVVLAAVVSAAVLGGSIQDSGIVAAAGFVPLGGALLARGGDPARRERAWELEAIGVALLAVAWLAGPAF
jgi:4-hydroxybenzoate polyprenyltransferase